LGSNPPFRWAMGHLKLKKLDDGEKYQAARERGEEKARDLRKRQPSEGGGGWRGDRMTLKGKKTRRRRKK